MSKKIRVAVFGTPGHFYANIVKLGPDEIPTRYQQDADSYVLGTVDTMDPYYRMKSFHQTSNRVWYGQPYTWEELFSVYKLLTPSAPSGHYNNERKRIEELMDGPDAMNATFVRTDKGRFYRLEPGDSIEPTEPGEISVVHTNIDPYGMKDNDD